jgi:energy-coupling factor transporter ATPase
MAKTHENGVRDPHVHFEDVSYRYDSGNPANTAALSDISLTVGRGEFVCVIGGNGSGKSTLARHINALLLPDGGRVSVEGMDTAERNYAFSIRKSAGMVFQNPDSQMVASIVADDVAFGPENLGIPGEEIHLLVDGSLSSVGMSDFAQASPANLSGGQKQRVSIAGILAMNPDILILDEPGAMLDPRGRRGIRRVACELNSAGMTVILITHFIEDTTLADRILVMAGGRIVASGTPMEIYGDEALLATYGITTPFSIQLSRALRRRGVEIDDHLVPERLREQICRSASVM